MLALDVKLEHLTIVPHLLAADFAFGNNFFRARVAESLHVLFDRRGVLLLQVLRKLLQLQDDQAAHGTGELAAKAASFDDDHFIWNPSSLVSKALKSI